MVWGHLLVGPRIMLCCQILCFADHLVFSIGNTFRPPFFARGLPPLRLSLPVTLLIGWPPLSTPRHPLHHLRIFLPLFGRLRTCPSVALSTLNGSRHFGLPPTRTPTLLKFLTPAWRIFASTEATTTPMVPPHANSSYFGGSFLPSNGMTSAWVGA